MRRGLIKISNELWSKEWNYIYPIFKDFKPRHIAYRENDIWYLEGESELFDEVEDGICSPEYQVIIIRSEDGSHTHKFQKV